MISLSLGWGVQSYTLAMMAATTDLIKVDVAIHADTHQEKSSTYALRAEMQPYLERRGVRIVTVAAPDTDFWRRPALCGIGTPPLFSLNPFGGRGQMHRSCTYRWKIAPIRRWLQSNRAGCQVVELLGISLDEALRMRPSDVKYVKHSWPLVEMRMNRQDCIKWLSDRGFPVPEKSSCVFCPYHDKASWSAMFSSAGCDWSKALEVDNAIRAARPPYALYLHQSRVPLSKAVLPELSLMPQLELWSEECSGRCFV